MTHGETLPERKLEAGAEGEGFYAQEVADVDIDQAIAGLIDKLRRLDRLIARSNGGWGAEPAQAPFGHLVRLLELYSQASSRLARLLRDRHSLVDETDDLYRASIEAACEELGKTWGIEL